MSQPAASPDRGMITDPAASYPGNRFIGASWRPDSAPELLARLRLAVSGWKVVEGSGWLIASENSRSFASTARLAFTMGQFRVFDRRTATLPDAEKVATDLSSSGSLALDGLAPPFRAIWADKAAGSIHGRTDVFGVGHVFVATGVGFAAIASSATLLADVYRAPASSEALAAFAIFGTFLAGETPFVGVICLPAAAQANLSAGRLTIERRHPGPSDNGDADDALRGVVEAMARAAPDAEIELSGGLDSRLILAAMPPSARKGRSAITIGLAGEASGDMTIAEAIARGEGLAWRPLDAGRLATLDADRAHGLLSRATTGYDHMANPLDKVALVAAAAGRSVGTRFGGQNGEILRGFYYPGQPLGAAPTEALARQLISLRLQVNDRVDDAILAPAMRQELRKAAEHRQLLQLLSLGGSWGETLDRFYLSQRMQVWVGNAASNRLMEHQPLYPFFDPAFVAAAMATPSAEKLNSRAAYSLLKRLDADLALRPLADGVVPATVASNGLMRRLQDTYLDVSRLSGRIARRLKGGPRSALGSQSAAQHWHRLELYRRLPLEQLARTGLFSAEGLERLGSGRWLPDRPTLGFVLMVAGLETRS